MIGNRFGLLTVISEAYGRSLDGRRLWNVSCDCGNSKVLNTSSLKKSKSCGCLLKNYFRDITGLKINYLTVISYKGKNKYKNNIYECICKCGNKIEAEKSDIEKSKIKSCGCLKIEKAKERTFSKKEALIRSLFRDYKDKAKSRRIFFNLSLDEFNSLILKNCYYCNSGPCNTKRNKKIDEVLLYNGIDRIDNLKGYILDNVVTSCYKCNQAKHTMSLSDFYSWIELIYNNIRKRK